jgi:hypothetical protein
MPRVRFEPTIPVFERAKTVHALYDAVIMVGIKMYRRHDISLIHNILKQEVADESTSIYT